MTRYWFSGLLLFSTALTACGPKASDDPQPVTQRKSESVGPFDVAFNEAGDYTGFFDAAIAQSSGKVEFYIPAGERRRLKVGTINSTTVGCSASQPVFTLGWNPDTDQSRMVVVNTGDTLTIESGKRGLLMVYFEHLDGCTRLQFSMGLQRLAPPPSIIFPSEFLGLWEKIDTVFGERLVFQMNFVQRADGVIAVTYTNQCGGGNGEGFEGQVATTDLTARPQRLTIRMDRITREFQGACGGVLALERGDAGRFLGCHAERSAGSYPRFRLSCVKSSQPGIFPSSWTAGTYWAN